jgi:peptide/nickel transport system permease protein
LTSAHTLRYAGKRLLFVPFAVFIVVSLSFLLINGIPSDPARAIAGDLATPQAIQQIDHSIGLDQSLGHRYVVYIKDVFLHGNLGMSYYSHRAVRSDLVQFWPSTVELVVLALVFAVIVGLLIGTAAAYWQRRGPDRGAQVYISFFNAIPNFFLGLVLIYFLFFKLRWAPAPTGQLGLLDQAPPVHTHSIMLDALIAGQWSTFRDAVTHAILPVLALGLTMAAVLAKTTRSVLGRALDSYQVEFARACGLSERQALGYGFRVARTPLITYGALLFTTLLGGAAVVETVFAWNGLGQWTIDRFQHLDLPEMEGIVLLTGLTTLLLLIVLDLLVAFLDPRVSYGHK